MEQDPVLHQQLPSAYRSLQPQAQQAINHGQPHLGHHQHHEHHGLSGQSDGGLDLTGLDGNESMFHQDLRLQDPNGHAYNPNPFGRNHGHQPMQQVQVQVQVQQNGSPHTPHQQIQHNTGGGQYGMLTPGPIQHSAIGRLQQDEDLYGPPEVNEQHQSNGHLNTKIVVDPPNLEEWRQKLFNVDEVITLSQDE